jgi:TIR domain
MTIGNKNPPARPGPKIFISYRRHFDQGFARLLKLELTKAFGYESVFRDVEDIVPGEVFPQKIDAAVKSCDTFLALISPGWVETHASLQNLDDFVRLEIAAALGAGVGVIPILIGGAQMPKKEDLPEEIRALTLRQAEELSDSRWDDDVRHLIEAIRKPFVQPPTPAPSFYDKLSATARSLFSTPRGLAVLAGLLVLVALAFILWRSFGVGHKVVLPAASIAGLAFDSEADCGDDNQECFWSVPSDSSGVERTGKIFGDNLTGGYVVIAEAYDLNIADMDTFSGDWNDHALRFSFWLKKSVPSGTGLTFKVIKPPMPGVASSDSQPWAYLVSFLSGQPTPAPTRAPAALGECFRQFLPRDRERWVGIEYGDPQSRFVTRLDQAENGGAAVLFNEDGRSIGAVSFRFVRSGQSAGGAVSGFFKIDRVVGANCRPVEDYSNPTGAQKDTLANYDYLDVLLDGRHYTLRIGYTGKGDVEAYFGKKPD